MNYKEINKAILNNQDIAEKLVEKDEAFYKYLFNNKVAYYYSKYLSTNKTEMERRIIKRGDELNEKYYKTVKLLKKICCTYNIGFLLFKTHKYIPEVVDGDIDIFVKEKDFKKFFDVFRNEGFTCVEDEPGKGKCMKDGFLLIEPHVDISWRNIVVLESECLWTKDIVIDIQGSHINSASLDIELYVIICELLFSPEYLDLLTIKKMFIFDTKSLVSEGKFGELIKKVYLLRNNIIKTNNKAPFFMSTFLLFKFLFGKIKYYYIAEICFKNTYWKFRYYLLNKLPFTHDWKI
jgi:hypothetical protein